MSTEPGALAVIGAKGHASAQGALFALSLAMLLSSLGTSIANVALPTLARAFGATFQDTQWIVLAYLLAVTTAAVSVGRLGDSLGRRRLLLAGLFLFTTASVGCASAIGLGMLVAARALQGLGAAVMMVLAMASVGETVPKERIGSAMGLLGTMSAVGTALGPSLGGALIAGAGWRAIFWINLPLGLLAAFLASRHLPAGRDSSRKPAAFDMPGTLLLVSALVGYALAMTPGHGGFGTLNVLLLLAALAGVVAFVAVEKNAASPLIRLAMFRHPVFAAGFTTSAIVMTVMMATLVVGPFYLSGALGLDAARTGLAMSCGPIVSALAGVPAGRLIDRCGASRMLPAALVAIAAGCALLASLPASWGVAGYIVPLVVVTSGYALFQAANNTAVLAEAQPEQRGVVSGLLTLSRNLGLVTGASAMGAVFAFGTGASDLTKAAPAAVATGMHFTFATAAAAVVGALAVALASSRLRSVR